MILASHNKQPGADKRAAMYIAAAYWGALGTILGNAKQNIADFRLGRTEGADSAVCLISLDAPLPDDLFKEVSNLPQVKTAKRLSF